MPGAVDVHVKQAIRYPALRINVDREKAAQLGLTEQSVANSMLISLSSSALIAPSYFLNPANNVNYIVAVRIPPERFDSVDSLMNTPLEPAGSGHSAASREPAADAARPAAAVRDAGQRFAGRSGLCAGGSQSLYGAARDRHQRQPAGPRSGSVVSGIQKKIDGLGKLPLGMRITHSRPVRGDEFVVPQLADGVDSRHRAGVSADRRVVSVLDRSFYYHDRGAGSVGRHSLDAGRDRLDDQRGIADGLDHGGRNRDFQLDTAGQLCQ